MTTIQGIERMINEHYGSHEIKIKMGHDAAQRRINAGLNRMSYRCGRCFMEGVQYAGESYNGEIVLETDGRYEFELCDEGAILKLRPHLLEDGETIDMETDWISLLPVIRWFLAIKEEDELEVEL